jgi:hypothetical protein
MSADVVQFPKAFRPPTLYQRDRMEALRELVDAMLRDVSATELFAIGEKIGMPWHHVEKYAAMCPLGATPRPS